MFNLEAEKITFTSYINIYIIKTNQLSDKDLINFMWSINVVILDW